MQKIILELWISAWSFRITKLKKMWVIIFLWSVWDFNQKQNKNLIHSPLATGKNESSLIASIIEKALENLINFNEKAWFLLN